MTVLIRGAGDMASGIALRLFHAGYDIVMTELGWPTAIRRTVSFSEAVRKGTSLVEDVLAVRAEDPDEARAIMRSRRIPVLEDPQGLCIHRSNRTAWWTLSWPAQYRDKDHRCGWWSGRARFYGGGLPWGGGNHARTRPGRVILEDRRKHRGAWHHQDMGGAGASGAGDGHLSKQGGHWRPGAQGDVVAEVNGIPMVTGIDGVLRGLLPDGTPVTKNMKSGDVDPRGEVRCCFTVSDKARAVGGGVLEALMRFSCK